MRIDKAAKVLSGLISKSNGEKTIRGLAKGVNFYFSKDSTYSQLVENEETCKVPAFKDLKELVQTIEDFGERNC